jgi:hypothetical protein
MKLPFTVEQFFGVFGRYNLAIWPVQLLTYLSGITAVILVWTKLTARHRIIAGILAFFWIWTGIAYHILYFSAINPAARIFGLLFAVQGLLFIFHGVVGEKMQFQFSLNVFSITGSLFIVYALILYPLIGKLSGHAYPDIPIFGVAPCPTTIFTFGILLLIDKPLPPGDLIIPFVWALIGVNAAASLHVPQDYGLFIAGVIGTPLILILNKRLKAARHSPGTD